MSSASLNRASLIGRVGSDPIIRETTNGERIANVSIATSNRWIDKKTGEKNEITDWHSIVFLGKLVEVVNNYVKKGDLIYVDGALQTKTYEDKQGISRKHTYVKALNLQILSSLDKNKPTTTTNEKTNTNESDLSSFDDTPF